MIANNAMFGPPTSSEEIAARVLLVRGQKVLLDSYLADLYGVPTKQLLQAAAGTPIDFPWISCFYWQIMSLQS